MMIAYKDCTYSLFISYAHADDSGEYGWVSSLRKAISQRLDKLDANIPKLGLHLSQDNGPTGGQLGSELRERVAQSFGMLLVIGEKYVSSKWCEKELKFFCEQFGEAGLKSRLYIAVMSEAAVTDAKKGDQWNLVMPEDQLWVPMFEKIERNKPLPHKMDAGEEGFPGLFAAGASKIADRLIIEIEKDYAESKQILLKPGTPGTPRVNVVSPVQRKKIVIGPHTSSLISTVDAIKSALENAGGEVTVLEPVTIYKFDSDDGGKPLRPLLAEADVLVVPMTLEPPLMPSTAGGHTTILMSEWAAAGKAERDLVWFRPTDIVVKPEEMASEKHLKCFEQLAPVCFSETALVNHVFGIGASKAILVHIEYHPKEHAFKRLARQLEAAWNALPPDASRPMLSCVQLDLDDLPNATKNAAGVVLLLPVMLKNYASLQSQIDQVKRLIPKKGTYPGCVAILYDPPLNTVVPKHDWSYVEFRKSKNEPKLTIEDESKIELEEFLTDLWERYRDSAAVGNGSTQ